MKRCIIFIFLILFSTNIFATGNINNDVMLEERRAFAEEAFKKEINLNKMADASEILDKAQISEAIPLHFINTSFDIKSLDEMKYSENYLFVVSIGKLAKYFIEIRESGESYELIKISSGAEGFDTAAINFCIALGIDMGKVVALSIRDFGYVLAAKNDRGEFIDPLYLNENGNFSEQRKIYRLEDLKDYLDNIGDAKLKFSDVVEDFVNPNEFMSEDRLKRNRVKGAIIAIVSFVIIVLMIRRRKK